MTVKFNFNRTIQTAYPGDAGAFTVFYNGEAIVSGGGEYVEILWAKQRMSGGQPELLTIPVGLASQESAPSEMRRFLGICRDAARKAVPTVEVNGVKMSEVGAEEYQRGFQAREEDVEWPDLDDHLAAEDAHRARCAERDLDLRAV